MEYSYIPKGVCSRRMDFSIEDNKLHNLNVLGGCDGNKKGLAVLAEGMDVDELIGKLRGIKCGFRQTSCPDQLARALEEYKRSAAGK